MSPLRLLFLSLFLSFAGHLLSLILGGRFFAKLLGSSGTSFLLEFSGQIFMFFYASFLCAFLLYHCIMLIWVWFERSLPLTPVRSKSKVSVSIKSDFTSSTRDVDLHGWLQTFLG